MIDFLLQKRAREALKDKKVLGQIVREALTKADRHRHRFPRIWKDLKALIRLIQAWFRGDYRQAPWRSMVLVVGAILYFLNPFDLIPDFLVIGFADDALVIGWVLASIKSDLEKFLLWEKTIPVEKISESDVGMTE